MAYKTPIARPIPLLRVNLHHPLTKMETPIPITPHIICVGACYVDTILEYSHLSIKQIPKH